MPLPGGPAGGVVVAVTLAKTTVLLASAGKATGLAVLVHGLGDPVDAGVAADRLVLGVDEDDLVVLVDTVLVNPVRVQDAEVAAAAANTLLSGSLQTTLGLELVDTLADGLAVGGTWESLQYRRRGMLQQFCAPLGTCFLRLPRRTRIR